MKKIALYAAAFCLAVSAFAGCGIKENVTESGTEETTEAWKTTEDEAVIARFYEAYDFWERWIYGQAYRAYDDPSQIVFGSSRESVTSDSPIQSVKALREEMEKHFTKELADKYWKQLVPEDKDGKLYVYTGDVGDSGEIVDNVTVKKISDTKYELTLDMTQYFDDEKYTETVYYVYEDGRWVFENDTEDEFFYSWGEPEKYNSEEFEPYNEILKAYYAALCQEWDAEKIDKHDLVDIISAFHGVEPLKCVGYSFMDINADGQNELLIGKVNAQDKIIWDMYAVKEGEAYRLLSSLERNRHYVYEEDGKYLIANERQGSAADYEFTYYTFDGKKLNTKKTIIYDGEKSTTEMIDEYRERYITPEFIPFETLG